MGNGGYGCLYGLLGRAISCKLNGGHVKKNIPLAHNKPKQVNRITVISSAGFIVAGKRDNLSIPEDEEF